MGMIACQLSLPRAVSRLVHAAASCCRAASCVQTSVVEAACGEQAKHRSSLQTSKQQHARGPNKGVRYALQMSLQWSCLCEACSKTCPWACPQEAQPHSEGPALCSVREQRESRPPPQERVGEQARPEEQVG